MDLRQQQEAPAESVPGLFLFYALGDIWAASIEAPTQAFDKSQWLGHALESGRIL